MLKPSFFVNKVPIYGDLILAPMAGFSDLPYRSICRALGSAMSYTEFVNVDELSSGKNGSKRARQKLCYRENERPIVFQIYGHDVDRIVDVAERIQELGPDIIDINMGCYVKKIAERGAGAGMLRKPKSIALLIRRLVNTLEIPVTAKIRLGWDEDNRNYMEIARILEDNGASLVAVHGRTKSQAYKGKADWDAIAHIKQLLSVPVVGNGDVCTVADINRIKSYTKCDAVMIGRAVIGNPWILQRKDKQDVTLTDRLKLVRKHLKLNLEFYGLDKGLILFRKHVAKYIEDAPENVKHLRVPLLTCEQVSDFEELLFSISSETHTLP
tara:strand:- start:409 stop:1386 length:978 start_codon:yes stop_codon:yes gene_type:complete